MIDDRTLMLEVMQNEWASRRKGVRVDIPENVEVKMNVVYGSGGGRDLTLDLFLPPAEFSDPRPAILYIHGGGWQGGTPAQFYRQAARLALKGIVGASCRYRFSSEAIFPAAVHDVKAAVRWLRASADELNLDTDRIGAMGGSSGGHLVAMLATTARMPELEGEGGNAGESSAISMAAPLNPVTDMTVFAEETNLHPAAVRFMGGKPDELPEEYRLASPLRHVDADTPPCMLVHGTGDTTVPHNQSVDFAEAVRAQGQRAELVLVEGAAHGFFNQDPDFEAIYEQIERFVLEEL
jgi:acetyl esterase/lipase